MFRKMSDQISNSRGQQSSVSMVAIPSCIGEGLQGVSDRDVVARETSELGIRGTAGAGEQELLLHPSLANDFRLEISNEFGQFLLGPPGGCQRCEHVIRADAHGA
jgi:hypothetical protein